MGYRHYLYIVERERVDAIKDMTPEELEGYAASNGVLEQDEDGEFCSYSFLMALTKREEFFGFGKYYENYKNMQKSGRPLFSRTETQELFEEYEPFVVEQDAVLCAIEYYKEKIVDWYDKLLMTQEEYDATCEWWERGELTQEQRIRRHLEYQRTEWKNKFGITAVNTDMKQKHIVNSWLYEYEIFELVHQMKMMDWEKNTLVFAGH